MRYHSTLGLDRDEITELVRRVFQVLESRPKALGRPPSLGLYRQVVLVLLYLRQNCSQTMLADLHGISQPTVSRIYRSIMPLLDQVLCVHEPDLNSVFCNREVVVDGTATVPYKRSKYHDLTGYEQTVNRTISTRRSAVERASGHLKPWKILATGYRGRLTELPNIIRITSRLEFYRLDW